MKENYEQSIGRFKNLQTKFIHKGVLNSDLPFLFHEEGNKKGILLIHGSQATPCNTIELGKKLSKKGYTTLGVLLKGHGINTHDLNSGNVTWQDCYNSALENLSLLENLVDDVYIVGSSFGGCLSYIMGIEFKDRISGIVALSAPTINGEEFPKNLWGQQIYHTKATINHHIKDLDVPTLIMHAIDDKVVSYNDAIFAYNNISTSQKKLITYDKIGHSLGFGFNTKEVAEDINCFIKNYKKPVRVEFNLEIENAYSVCLVGEFNNWENNQIQMSYENGRWTTSTLLTPGNYQYKFVIDQEKWVLDPKAEKTFTPRGSENSIIRIF